MKHSIFRRTSAFALALLLGLSLTACSGNGGHNGSFGKPDSTPPAENTATAQPEATPTETSTPPADNTDTDDIDTDIDITPTPAEHSFSDEAQAALDDLIDHRQQELFAAAAIGYREEGDTTDLAMWLHNEAPSLAVFWPFLEEIPEEDIVGDHGYLYCIVPLDEAIPLTIKSVEWEYLGNGSMPHYSDPLYCGEVGKPFLLYSTCESFVDDADVVVETVEENGFVGTWSPAPEPDGKLVNPLAWHGGNVVLDFTHIYEVGDYYPGAEWLPPTALGLADTSWYSDNGWVLEFSYDENAAEGSGDMVLYQPVEDEEGAYLTPFYQGSWWMDDDCLCLGVYDGHCPFPLLISPSGEQLVVMQADDGSVLPFFERGQTTCSLTLSYG